MSTKFKSNDGDESVGDAAREVFKAVEDVSFNAVKEMQDNGDHHAAHHLYVALTAAAAAVQLAAKIMCTPVPGDKTAEELVAFASEPVDRTAVLTASLLIARCLLPGGSHIAFDFDSRNINAAIEATKLVSGSSDVSVLNRKMRESASRHATPTHFFDNTRDQYGDLIPTIH